MTGVRVPRWVATVVAVGIGLVALLGLTAPDAVVPATHDCAGAATVVCEPSVVSAQPASQSPADPAMQTSIPCLHSAGCGGGGAMTLIGAGLALLLVSAPLVLPPRSLSQPVRPLRTTRLPRLLLARDDGQPPRLSAVI